MISRDNNPLSRLHVPSVSPGGLAHHFGDVVQRLKAVGRNRVAEALEAAKEAVMSSPKLSEEQKQARVEAITEIGEETAKQKPDETRLQKLARELLVEPLDMLSTTQALECLVQLLSSIDWDSIDIGPIDFSG